MKYLIITEEGQDEIWYDLADIEKINCDYAQNILREADLEGNGIKPLELLIVISFTDGNTATFNAVKCEMYFDKYAKETSEMKELEPQKRYQIEQVAATMEIEDMPLDRQTHKNLIQLATGERTADQIIHEIKKAYGNG